MIGLPIGKQNQYAPGTLAADVHRLLDPYYAYEPGTSPASAHFHTGEQAKAYVDCAGALHDPDYREFPEFPVRRSSSGRGSKRPAATQRTRSPVRAGYGRPSWERGYDDDDSEDETPEPYYPWGFRRAASDLTSSASGRSRSDSDSSWYYGQPARQELYNFNHRPSFEEDVEDLIEEPRVATEVAAPSNEDTVAVCKSTPTCGEAIRYQMTALSLHLRLSVFRAKRRWREKRKGISSG